jgi:hypothetical protein
MKATCPKNPQHQRFITTAHVMQEWAVDPEGEFLEEITACLDVTQKPNVGNTWTCAICGEEAEVE